MYRLGDTVGLGSLKTFLLLVAVGTAQTLSRTLKWDIFPEAVAAHGELPYDQSFIFVPLLSMGGSAKVENLHKRDTIPAIQVAVDLQGAIGH
ncbi:T6SS immunity protein Tdi1 domain-containing protein [Microbacterium sp. NPDC057650]|uniref:T6SS immunity protein Tdi1 domain-containing protein n=1 Tax=unclassified Microbacterium TaxID=2609290 RepID=UPI00367043E7